MSRHYDMHETAPFVGLDHEDEQQAVRDRRDNEEVGGSDLWAVIREKRTPGLGRWVSSAHHYVATVA